MDYRKRLILLIFIALLGLECLETGSMSTAVLAKQAEICPQAEESRQQARTAGSLKAETSRQVSKRDYYPGIVRFHVIANSDSREDQNLKLKVRDYVMPKLEEELAACLTELNENQKTDTNAVVEKNGKTRNYSDGKSNNEETAVNPAEQERIKAYISENLEKINGWAKECLEKNDSSFGVKTELGVRRIPGKQYDDIYFPAGNYESLTIKIGKAEGENWWCVVFPPLCLIDSTGAAYNENLNIGMKDRLVIKSKVKELLAQRERLTKKEQNAKKKQLARKEPASQKKTRQKT